MTTPSLPTGQLATNTIIDAATLEHIKHWSRLVGALRPEELEAFFVARGFARKKTSKRIASNCTQRLRKAGRIEHVRKPAVGWVAK